MTNYLPPTTPAQNANNVSTSIQREGKLFVQVWDGTEKVQVNPDGSISTIITDGTNDAALIGNKLRVSSVPYTYDIAEGNVPDQDDYQLIVSFSYDL